jgi:hypothetical protein
LNRAEVDFTAKTVYSTSVYNNGNLWSKEIRVAVTNPWADYVFNKDYPLRSLASLKNYISQNHRLPDLPSAIEVEKQGINIGEINTLLVKKVEELTLYLIDLKKENEKLNQRLKRLENKK